MFWLKSSEDGLTTSKTLHLFKKAAVFATTNFWCFVLQVAYFWSGQAEWAKLRSTDQAFGQTVWIKPTAQA